jgi:NitT/TauT family transport system substrate-binding protein
VLQSDSPDLLVLFGHRQIDAALVPEPWGARLEEREAAEVTLTELQLMDGTTMPSTLMVAHTPFLERRPEWARALVAAHRKLVREINADPAAMSARVNEALKLRLGKALKPPVLRRAWDRLTITDQVEDPRLQEFAAMMRDAGYLRAPFDPIALRYVYANSDPMILSSRKREISGSAKR